MTPVRVWAGGPGRTMSALAGARAREPARAGPGHRHRRSEDGACGPRRRARDRSPAAPTSWSASRQGKRAAARGPRRAPSARRRCAGITTTPRWRAAASARGDEPRGDRGATTTSGHGGPRSRTRRRSSGSPRHARRGTLGGNIVNASPAADTVGAAHLLRRGRGRPVGGRRARGSRSRGSPPARGRTVAATDELARRVRAAGPAGRDRQLLRPAGVPPPDGDRGRAATARRDARGRARRARHASRSRRSRPPFGACPRRRRRSWGRPATGRGRVGRGGAAAGGVPADRRCSRRCRLPPGDGGRGHHAARVIRSASRAPAARTRCRARELPACSGCD